MWRVTLCLLMFLLTAGCGQPAPPPAPMTATDTGAAGLVDPARIKRVRADLPPGYEVADASGVDSPANFWGLRSGWSAEPPQCAALVSPVDGGFAQGLSGSGDGGLLYVAVVSDVAPVPGQAPAVELDGAVLADCGQWSMSVGRSSATVSLIEAPHIDGVDTVGMSTAINTVVESGTETNSQAQTFTAYLGEHFVFVTLIVDPGSPHPPLPPQYAADLLVKTVSVLRG